MLGKEDFSIRELSFRARDVFRASINDRGNSDPVEKEFKVFRMNYRRRDFLVGSSTIAAASGLVASRAALGDDQHGGANESNSSARSISGSAAVDKVPESAGDPPLAPPDKQPPDLFIAQAPAKKLGWAIVGLGKLSMEELMPAFAECRIAEPKALVSGHRSKAEQVANVYNIAKSAIYSYENYDQIAKDDSIQIVYIVLPNSIHAEYTIRALEAGKHVLCEKPMAVTIEESTRMIDAAKSNNRKLGIAYRLHHEPMNMAAAKMCSQGTFGKVRTISTSFGQNVTAPNIRLSGELGGGPLGDIGLYCLNATRYLTGEEPNEVMAQAFQPKDDPRFREVPASVSFQLRFPSGALASADCTFASASGTHFRVLCEKGIVEMSPAFQYRGLRLETIVESPEDIPGNQVPLAREHQFPEVNQFAHEMDDFTASVLEDRPFATEGGEGLRDMKIMAAINQSIREQRAVKLEG